MSIRFFLYFFMLATTMLTAAPAKPVTIFRTNNMYEPTMIQKAVEQKKPKHEVKNIFVQQIAELKKLHSDLNKALPDKTDELFRIATYNIMGEKDPHGMRTTAIYDEIKKINADIIIIQEAQLPHTVDMLKEQGYQYTTTCAGSGVYGDMVNVIASKVPFAKTPIQHKFKHTIKGGVRVKHQLCFVKVTVDVQKCINAKAPADKTKMPVAKPKPLVIYGVHLDGNNAELRLGEIQHLKQMINEYDKGSNVLVAGSFNETRTMPALTLFEEGSADEKNKTGFTTPFTKLGFQEPYFTHWSGKELDFIYVKEWYAKNNVKIVDWTMPINGCYLYYSSATGRMPVIMDLVCKTQDAKKV